MAATVETAVNILRAKIMSGELKQGEKLREVELCRQLEISRTPLREAFRVLQSEGFLCYQPNSGVLVTTLTMEDVVQLQEIRHTLEPIAARYAAGNITAVQLDVLREINENLYKYGIEDCKTTPKWDMMFHKAMVATTQNPTLQGYLTDMCNRTNMQSNLLPILPERLPHTYQEHCNIIDALEQHDPELTAKYVSIHFYMSQKSFNKKLEAYINAQPVKNTAKPDLLIRE